VSAECHGHDHFNIGCIYAFYVYKTEENGFGGIAILVGAILFSYCSAML